MKRLNSCAFFSISLQMFLLFSFHFLAMQLVPTASALSNETDRAALLKMKEFLTVEPHGVLNTWNDSTHFCNWLGVTCSTQHQRVTALKLGGYNLRGELSPYIGNLSCLRIMDLHNNSFYGQIPKEFGHLFNLQELLLANNKLTGNFPTNLANCSALKIIDFGHNNFTGTIPVELGSLTKLEELDINTNRLAGGLPSCLGNISLLKHFDATDNNLVGMIPDEIGLLKYLSSFEIATNNLSGTIPSSLYHISSIQTISLAGNQLLGILPDNIGSTLPNLQVILCGDNKLSGSIPTTLFNISSLYFIDFYNNNFVGPVPTNLGNLQHLWRLGLGKNNLGSNSSKDLDFLASLANCSKLEFLDLGYNNFGGVLPKTIGNLSAHLGELYFDFNKISGSIPAEIGNLVNLVTLTMQDNLFTGTIPSSFGKFQKLQVMSLSENILSEQIPQSIGNLTEVIELHLYKNRFVGTIPSTIGDCQHLQYMDISQNNLSGAIPSQVIGLSSLSIVLNLSGNFLSGSLPREVGNLKNINSLDLSENNLSGEIPDTIGNCEMLEYLFLQGNSFRGYIPSSMASLKGLLVLDLSRNNLSGEIPDALQKLPPSLYLNLSFNNLQGEVPEGGLFNNATTISVTGNNLLCGGVQELRLPPCPVEVKKPRKAHTRSMVILIISVVLLLIILATSFAVCWMRKSKKSPSSTSLIFGENLLKKVSYRMLHQATNGFSHCNLIGSGSFSSVYKGTYYPEERAVAVKVLNLQKQGASKSFLAECNVLKNIRHRNLVKLLTCCSSIDYKGNDFKALVFEFMENGSLEKWLHPENCENQSLNLLQRLNIIIDVAFALCYIHHEHEQPIIHRDIKPSNVLLDSNMVAHLCDFGLAMFLPRIRQNQISTIGLKGTPGYTAPEYGMGGQASKEGDIYSFGILVLEMFTGRSPTHEMFGDGFNLHNYVKSAMPHNFVHVVDPFLLQEEAKTTAEGPQRNAKEITEDNFDNNVTEYKSSTLQIGAQMHHCLLSVFKVGLACSVQSPKERKNIRVVIPELLHIRNVLLAV